MRDTYEDIRETCVTSGLAPRLEKLVPPTAEIIAFNCDLRHGFAAVTPARIIEYYERADRTPEADAAFEEYAKRVASASSSAAPVA